MARVCDFKGCSFGVFAKNYCKFHQWCRPDKKIKASNKRPVRTVSNKRKSSLGERKFVIEKDRLFYASIWEERDHIDFETGKPIYGEPLSLYFHHVLEKAIPSYKKYRHCTWNIVLISWQTHDQVGMDIDHVPRIKAYRDWLIKHIKQIDSGKLIPDTPIFNSPQSLPHVRS